MMNLKRLAFTLALILSVSLLCRAQERPTPSIEVSAASDHAQFSARGEIQQMRLEVFSPSGERIFDSGAVFAQSIEWDMRGRGGRRVEDGVYLASVSIVDADGKVTRRVEQVMVGAVQTGGTPQAPVPPNPDAPVTTASGTAGKIAKFTTASNIENSVMTENSSKIGINVAPPTAILHVNGLQPASVAINGTTAAMLLQTSGGKGGNTTGVGKFAGKGASISLLAGTGGNAPAGGFNGPGGNITLEPGSAGTGGTGGAAGNVLLAPTTGNVGIGLGGSTPAHKLTVKITGAGTAVSGESSSGVGVSGSGGTGKGVYGQSTSNSGVYGFSGSGDGVTGQSGTGYAGQFFGKGKFSGNLEIGGNQSFGAATRQMINLYNQTYGIGVQAGTHYFRTDGGYNWYRGGVHNNTENSPGTGGTSLMVLNAAGHLNVKGAVTAIAFIETSDRNAKTNFSTINPRSILDKLAAIPVQTWRYKGEAETVRHMGPVAQDFHAAFNLGSDDKTIWTIDSAGVTMAAVQGLYQLSQEKDKQIEQLTEEAKALRSEVDELKARLQRLEEAIKGQQK